MPIPFLIWWYFSLWFGLNTDLPRYQWKFSPGYEWIITKGEKVPSDGTKKTHSFSDFSAPI